MALPVDEMELISKKLTFPPDYTRFRSVCKAWRSAAPKHPQIPWLIATDDVEDNFLILYQFSFEANKFIQFPELSKSSCLSSFIDNSNVIIRSSRGWLFLLDLNTKSVSLINPLTDSIINLPNLPNLSEEYDLRLDIAGHRFGFSLTSDPGELLPDCFALIYYNERISYCKVGSSVWIEMQHPEIHRLDNIHICCYGGQFFITSGGDVLVCDFGQNPSVCKLASFNLNGTGASEVEVKYSYLVESDGDLLLVVADYIYYRSFKVFKLEFGCQMGKLVELKSLGDKTLFLSRDTSFSLTASKYLVVKKILFTCQRSYVNLMSYVSMKG